MLYDVTGGPRLVDPVKAADNPYTKALKRRLHPATFLKLEKTVRKAVDALVRAKVGKLTWTAAGPLFGFSSTEPHADIEHLWESVIAAVGPGKECLISVGCLLKTEIASRPERHWLVFKKETGETDPITEKPIFVSEYWISSAFKPPVKAKPTVAGLGEKWGARVKKEPSDGPHLDS